MKKIANFGILILSLLLLSSCENELSQSNGQEYLYVVIGCTMCLLFCIICVAYVIFALRRDRSHKNIEFTQNDQRTGIPPSLAIKEWKAYKSKVEEQENRIIILKNEIIKLKDCCNDLYGKIGKVPDTKQNPAQKTPNNTSRKSDDTKKESNPKGANNTNKVVNKVIERPTNASEYKYLRVLDGGKLAPAASPDNAYYRSWKSNGTIYYEFASSKEGKAINNRTSIIEPFCEIILNDIDPDTARSLQVVECGTLSDDLSVVKKVIIKYTK